MLLWKLNNLHSTIVTNKSSAVSVINQFRFNMNFIVSNNKLLQIKFENLIYSYNHTVLITDKQRLVMLDYLYE